MMTAITVVVETEVALVEAEDGDGLEAVVEGVVEGVVEIVAEVVVMNRHCISSNKCLLVTLKS